MITPDAIVTTTGRTAGSILNGDSIDSIRDTSGVLESATAFVLDDTVDHMCQEIVTTPSGARVICSNNSLLYVDDPSRGGLAVVNCQRIGGARIAVLINGLLTYEYAQATPYGITPVVQLLVPGGAIIAGQDPNARILITALR